MTEPAQVQTVRHILSLSGGKDSSALAVYMRDRVPDMEYVFCDTAKELDETYAYLDRLEGYLGKEIVRLRQSAHAFDDLLAQRRGFLPSPQMRWCTELLKIKPFEVYVGTQPVINYIGIRADEHRTGYISSRRNITAKYPFIEDGVVKSDVETILVQSGLGLPSYYEWRSRSGCFFCFFQQRIEWVGLLERHPGLFWEAARYEKVGPETDCRYTWVARESLAELAQPDRVSAIKREFAERRAIVPSGHQRTLGEILADEDEAQIERPCIVCDL
jgi:hypothetical protein